MGVVETKIAAVDAGANARVVTARAFDRKPAVIKRQKEAVARNRKELPVSARGLGYVVSISAQRG